MKTEILNELADKWERVGEYEPKAPQPDTSDEDFYRGREEAIKECARDLRHLAELLG